jgi:hypothetical protein
MMYDSPRYVTHEKAPSTAVEVTVDVAVVLTELVAESERVVVADVLADVVSVEDSVDVADAL